MTTEWKASWHAICPRLSTKGLEELKKALEDDSPELIQGETTSPPSWWWSMGEDDNFPIEKACGLAYCGWKDGSIKLVNEADDFLISLDRGLPQTALTPFLLWFDETPREEMRKALLEEVVNELWKRANTFEVVAS